MSDSRRMVRPNNFVGWEFGNLGLTNRGGVLHSLRFEVTRYYRLSTASEPRIVPRCRRRRQISKAEVRIEDRARRCGRIIRRMNISQVGRCRHIKQEASSIRTPRPVFCPAAEYSSRIEYSFSIFFFEDVTEVGVCRPVCTSPSM